jgi:hypothetical protein
MPSTAAAAIMRDAYKVPLSHGRSCALTIISVNSAQIGSQPMMICNHSQSRDTIQTLGT